jgi:hypothetical protein
MDLTTPQSAAPAPNLPNAPSSNQPAIKPITNTQKNSPNFITFEKGVGSSTFGVGAPGQASPSKADVAQALEKFKEEKWFPNGLKEADEPIPQPMKGGEPK